jgi:hypothetical protein
MSRTFGVHATRPRAGLQGPQSFVSKMLEDDMIVDEDERRAHHARQMLEQILALSSRIGSRNTISLDKALKRYAAVELRPGATDTTTSLRSTRQCVGRPIATGEFAGRS